MDRSQYFLAQRLSVDQYAALQAAATSDWDPGFARAPENKPAVDAVVFQRHDNTVRHVVPWIEQVRPLADAHVIDFGSGCGSSALAFSHFAARVTGFEIHRPSIEAFRARMALFGVGNATVTEGTPSDLIDKALDQLRPGTIFVMLAVVEHLLESERLDYLRRIWQRLAPGDLLVIAETPNYLSWFDTHTFQVPFAHMVPDHIFVAALQRDARALRFKTDVLATAERHGIPAALEKRRRLGLGPTHHLFEVAFEADLNEVVVGDGFQPQLLGWFTLMPDDRLLLSAFDMYKVDLPVGFARSVLSFIFRKPASSAQAREAKDWNRTWREEVIATHSMVRQLESYKRLAAKLDAAARG